MAPKSYYTYSTLSKFNLLLRDKARTGQSIN